MTSTLRGKVVGGRYDKSEMLSDLVGGGVSKCSGSPFVYERRLDLCHQEISY